MTNAQKILALTGDTELAQACEQRVIMDGVYRKAKSENHAIALEVMKFFKKALASGRVTDLNGGSFSVPHFLARFEAIPSDLQGYLFDDITRATLSVRECEWVAVKTITRLMYAGRTSLAIVSKRKNGEDGSAEVIPFSEIDFSNHAELEASKLVVTIAPRKGANTRAVRQVRDFTAEEEAEN